MTRDQSVIYTAVCQCQWIAVSSFFQPVHPAETETNPHRSRGPACHPQGTRTIGGPRQVDLLWRKPSPHSGPCHPYTRNDPTQNSLADSLSPTCQKASKLFVVSCPLGIPIHLPPPPTTPRDSRSLRLENHSTQFVSSGVFSFQSTALHIFNRNGLCSTIHRLDQGRCRRPEGCRQRPWPAQRSPALLQIRLRRCRLLLDNTRCPHPRRCVCRFFLTRVQFNLIAPSGTRLCFSFATDASAVPAVAGRSSIKPGTPSALRVTILTSSLITESRPVSSSTLSPTTEA